MARTPIEKKSGVAIEMFGMDDFLRDLRRAPKETRKAVNHGSREIAKTVLVQMKRRSRTVFHAAQYQTIISSLKTPVGSVPKIKAGGASPKGSRFAQNDQRQKEPARPPAKSFSVSSSAVDASQPPASFLTIAAVRVTSCFPRSSRCVDSSRRNTQSRSRTF